jgi:hypothetical protein
MWLFLGFIGLIVALLGSTKVGTPPNPGSMRPSPHDGQKDPNAGLFDPGGRLDPFVGFEREWKYQSTKPASVSGWVFVLILLLLFMLGASWSHITGQDRGYDSGRYSRWE